METIVLITGGFDPLHSGHLAYFTAAKKLGQHLVVGVNSDLWLTRKKGRVFMSWSERSEIVRNISSVDQVIEFDDHDGSARHAIKTVRSEYPNARIIFANGGDRTPENIPEMDIVDSNLEFRFGVGGSNKKNSSSWILEEWKSPKTHRQWGYYRVLSNENQSVKLKELVVEPGKKLSMQRHSQRNEFWFVSEGQATVYTVNNRTDLELLGQYQPHQWLFISTGQWHQLCNDTDKILKLIEIQYGENCQEEDIERYQVDE
jgi:cytidyltransferase-like protein